MNRNLSPLKLLLISGIALAIIATGFWMWAFINKANDARELPVLSELQSFALTEKNDEILSLDDLKGQIWVADFIFTRCGGPCLSMSKKMSQLQTAFAHADDVKLVSVSVDPEFDTPAVLRDYADRFNAKPEKWLFLTGEKPAVLELAKSSMKVTVEEATDSSPIIHSTYFILVDQLGNIRGYYNSAEPNALSQLAVDVEKLRAKAGA